MTKQIKLTPKQKEMFNCIESQLKAGEQAYLEFGKYKAWNLKVYEALRDKGAIEQLFINGVADGEIVEPKFDCLVAIIYPAWEKIEA